MCLHLMYINIVSERQLIRRVVFEPLIIILFHFQFLLLEHQIVHLVDNLIELYYTILLHNKKINISA